MLVYKLDAIDCRSACIIQHDLHILSQIETRIHNVRTIESEGFFMPQELSSPKRVLLVEDIDINRVSCSMVGTIN